MIAQRYGATRPTVLKCNIRIRPHDLSFDLIHYELFPLISVRKHHGLRYRFDTQKPVTGLLRWHMNIIIWWCFASPYRSLDHIYGLHNRPILSATLILVNGRDVDMITSVQLIIGWWSERVIMIRPFLFHIIYFSKFMIKHSIRCSFLQHKKKEA